jgi:hypothetical protein
VRRASPDRTGRPAARLPDVGMVRLGPGDPTVDPPGDQRLVLLVADHLGQTQLDPRVSRAQPPHQPRDHRAARRRHEDERQGPRARRLPRRVGQARCPVEQISRARQQRLARRRELHALRMPVEQRRADLVLELSNLQRQRWLRDEQLLGRAAQVAGFGHGDEVTQVPELHGVSLLGRYGEHTQ